MPVYPCRQEWEHLLCNYRKNTPHTHKQSLHSFPVVSLSPRFKLVKSFGAMWLTSSLHWLVFHSASTFKLHSVAALFNTAFVDKSRSKVPHAEPWVLNLTTSNTNNADQNRVPYPLRARCYFIGTKKNINLSTRTARERPPRHAQLGTV